MGNIMDTSKLFKKENLFKVLAIAGVAIFVFEMFALGYVGSYQNSETNQTNIIEGEVIANVTVSAYQPYIITNLKNETLAKEISKLPGVEELVLTSQGYVVSLKNVDNITEIYSYLQKRDVSGRTNTILTFKSPIEISYGQNQTQKVSGRAISAKLEPIFTLDEVITIKLFVRAKDKQLIEYGAITVLPSEKEIERNVTVVKIADTKTIIFIPWENRQEIAAQLETIKEKYGNSSVNYVSMDYITMNNSFNRSTLPPYVTLMAENTIYVQTNFTDKAAVLNDFPGSILPDSLLTINSDNVSEFENFSRSLKYKYNVRLEENGEPIFFALESTRAYNQNDTINVIIKAYAIKDKIISISSVREAETTTQNTSVS